MKKQSMKDRERMYAIPLRVRQIEEDINDKLKDIKRLRKEKEKLIKEFGELCINDRQKEY